MNRLSGKANAVTEPERVQRALDQVRELLEAFTFDLARLLAGHEVDFSETLTRELAGDLVRRLQPMLSADARLAPDFGHFAELRIEGDLASAGDVTCHVRFMDQSGLEDRRGHRLQQYRRTVEMHSTVSLTQQRVVACSFMVEP